MPSLSKSEVSTIIDKAIKNSNPSELPLKGLQFGQLWHEAGDYNNASQWLNKYLRVYDRDAHAHRLLGQCYEKLFEYELALTCYKQSLQIKPLQSDLILHIVELFLNPGPTQNPNKAKIWLDKASATLPGNPAIFKLKMELLVAQQASPSVLEKAIKQELKLRDNDFTLHEEYISFLKTQGDLRAAQMYCNDLENVQSPCLFCDTLEWCACVVSTYKDYYELLKSKCVPVRELLVPQCLLMEALIRYIWLLISDKKFDQSLQLLQTLDGLTYTALSQSTTGEWHIVEEEIKAQISWIAATHLLYQTYTQRNPHPEAQGLCLVLYSYSLSKPIPALNSTWAMNCARLYPNLPTRIMKNAGTRVSESSHMVHVLNNLYNTKTLVQNLNLEMVGQKVYNCLWGGLENAQFSFLCNNKALGKSEMFVPTMEEMLNYDQIASGCGKLHNIVWLGIRWCKLDYPSDFFPWMQHLFPKLRLATNADSKSALMLTPGLLDMEVFVASCVFTTERQIQIWSETYQGQASQSFESPPSLIRKLTTEQQEKWWLAAKVLSSREKPKQSAAELSKMKPILLRGLECLRGMGNHHLQTMLATKLAKYFESKAFLLQEESGISSGWFAYQRRAAVYWSLVLPDLQRAVDGRILHKPKPGDSLFPPVFKEPTCDEATSFLSDANMCHGELATQENRIDDALTFYGKATMPQASFCQAHLYKKLSESAVTSSVSQNPLVDGEKQKQIYFKKYKHCLEVTLTRLQQHPDDKLHERTVSLLASLQITPPRVAANMTKHDSVLPGPSKQSTPKLDESVTNSVLSTLVEKDSVTNLVDGLASLTSAVSSLKLEMGQLREESRVKQYTPSPSFNAHATPQRVIHPEQLANLPIHPMTPPVYGAMQDGFVQSASTLTPQRPFIPQQSNLYPGIGRDGRIATPNEIPVPYIDAYRQQQQQLQHQAQQQAFYSPLASSGYYGNYPYQAFPPEAMLNGHTMTSMQNSQAYSNPAALAKESKPSNIGFNQQSNVLAACLQNKGSTEALQQRLGSALAGVTSSPVSTVQQQMQAQVKPLSYESYVATKQTPPDNTTSLQQTPTSQKAAPAPEGKSSLIQQLLMSDATTKQQNTAPPKKDIEFLSKFVTPKSGVEHKFQSPEQMDKENQELDALENADNDTSNNNDTGPHFEPRVTLPEVETVTGEEDEDVMFQERCRLFRWDDNQWKERGVGDMKVLRHKTTGKARLVMRRDQVHKVCCNQLITKTLTLLPMQSSERALVWTAVDFSEEESKNEQLAARFKTSEIAQKFKAAVNTEAEKASSSAAAEKEEPVKKEALPATEVGQTATPPATETAPSSITKAASSFKFVMPKPSDLKETKPKEPEPEPSKPSVFAGLAGALTKGFGGTGPEGGVRQGSVPFSFGKPMPRATAQIEQSKKVVEKPAEEEEDEEDNALEVHNRSDGPYFAPKIDLPDLVEVKTGEEDEEVMFSQRAKLFRFVDSQWKERGVGDIKILKHKATSKYRIVMRREQVLKLCANHYITATTNLTAHGNQGKAWTWVAQDFSEVDEEPHNEMLAVKFGSAERAADFKEQVDLAVDAIITQNAPKSPSRAATAFLRKEAQDLERSKQASTSAAQPSGISPKPFMQQRAAGSWECQTCMANNPPTEGACKCCGTANPNAATQGTSTAIKPTQSEEKPKFSFGLQSSQAVTFGSTSKDSAPATGSLKELLARNQAAGTWECPECMAKNPPEVFKCKCCGANNPSEPPSAQSSAPEPAKPGSTFGFGLPSSGLKFSFGLKPGQTSTIFGQAASSSTGSSFSFGLPQDSQKETAQGDHRVLQRATGSQPSTGLPFSFGKPASGAPISFGTNEGIFKSPADGAGGGLLPKPRFPSLGDEKESGDVEEEESESSSSSTDYDDDEDNDDFSSDDEDEEESEPSTHQSPMTKFQNQAKEKKSENFESNSDEDVICLGEVLPSVELQEKAKSLMLPPHFYNYLEQGDGSGEESDSESSTSAEQTFPVATSQENVDEKPQLAPTFRTSSVATFAQLAATKSTFSFAGVKPSTTPDAWLPDPKPMFSQPAKRDEGADDSGELYKDEERDDIHFEPIVKLPEKVSVVTGEEEEETLYSQRAKLFRWDSDSSQWKERGVGNVCVKYNQSTKKYRILMRREQVLKVCANHYLTPSLKLQPLSGSDRAWTWVAADFSEGGDSPTMEKFAIRFKDADLAEQFKDKLQECQILMDDTSSESTQATAYIDQVEKMKSELGYFKDKLMEKPKIDLENTITEGLVTSNNSKFDPSKISLTPLVQRHIKEKTKADEPATAKEQAKEDKKKEENGAKTVAPIGLKTFEFKMKADVSPTKLRGVSECSATSEDSNVDIHFEPRIPLPDKVDVVTGEEDEQVLFGSRSKLFVFSRDTQEWKERGLGEIKLLQDTRTFKIRLVMRRDQVLKVCLNHRVTSDMTFTNKEPKVLLWTATDFSDRDKPDGELLQFAIKFKTPEIAASFLEAMDEAKKAADEEKLLESFQGSIEQSYTTAPEDESVVSGGGESSKSLQRSPVKPFPSVPVFSFAKVESPLQKDFSKGFKFSENLFTKEAAKPAADFGSKFNFSSISFNFGSTSTPAPPSNQPSEKSADKPAVIKSLFGPDSSSASSSSSSKPPSAISTLFAQPSTSKTPFTFSTNSNNAKADLTKPESKAVVPTPSAATPLDDDVIFVWEATPTEDQRRRANELRLPPTFFMYEDNPDLRDVDSDEEDRILEFIRRRDEPQADVRARSQSPGAEQSRDESAGYVAPETPPPEEDAQPEAVSTQATVAAPAPQSQIGEGGNLFGNFATASTFSFAAMASNAAPNQSFGSRKDAAFNVSAADKVLFSHTEKEQDPEAFDPEYKPAMAEPPPLIDAKTGEEDEKILFQERCKLFRFDEPTNSWKERGLGDIKILHHPQLRTYRVVMRREQVLKVCANHLINPSMKLLPSTEKSWLYVAQDRSEGGAKFEKFTVRFKYPEIANRFKQVWDSCSEQQ